MLWSVESTDFFGRPIGPHRVWMLNKSLPGIAMTRSLGDTIAKSIGVIFEPEIQLYCIDDKMIIIIGSDGLWEKYSNEEVLL
jgi:serine/threonine protein phosphatase PrpC